MSRYRVNLIATACLTVEVEAENREAAIEAAYDNDQYLCAQCSGWGRDWDMDLDDFQLDESEYGVEELAEDES